MSSVENFDAAILRGDSVLTSPWIDAEQFNLEERCWEYRTMRVKVLNMYFVVSQQQNKLEKLTKEVETGTLEKENLKKKFREEKEKLRQLKQELEDLRKERQTDQERIKQLESTADKYECIPNKAEMYIKEDQNQHVEDQNQHVEDQNQRVEDWGKVTTVKIPEYYGKSCTDMFSFEVDVRGCNVITKYCKLQIPPNATTGQVHIRMEPRYNIAECYDDKIFICPEVTFTSDDDDLAFTKKVTVSLHTPYSACAGKTISVEVVWRENLYSPFQTHISKLDHRDERFITFVTEHFCGFSVIVDESQFQNTMCSYQSVAYVRKPIIPTTRLFHWLIFEDSPALQEEKIKYLNDKDTVVDPELIHVRYGFDLQLRIDGPSVGIVGNDDSCLKLTDKWGSRVSESFQFKIEANHRDPTSQMKYNITGLHHRTHTQCEIKQKPFWMEWSVSQIPSTSTTVNVTGKQAVGISINNDSARNSMQQLTSTSDVESGVFSPMHMPQYISNNENSGQDSHSMQQSTSASYVEPGVFSPMHNQMPQNISSNEARAFRDQDPPLMRHSTPIPNEFDDDSLMQQSTSSSIVESGIFSTRRNLIQQNISSNETNAFHDQDPPPRHSTPIPKEFDDSQSTPINDTETSGYSSMIQARSSLDLRQEAATGIPGLELEESIVMQQSHPEEIETVPKRSLDDEMAAEPSPARSFNSDLEDA